MPRTFAHRWLQRIFVLSVCALLVDAALAPPPNELTAFHGLATTAQIDAAVPGWPASGGLLVAEVVTRGGAASDQYVELYNAAPVPLSLHELELVYVTASGLTITRKQSWADLLLGPGQRLLLANSAGAYAAIADGLFSGGFSTTGGSLVLRPLGGEPIDSLSWGTAAGALVEGSPGPAPAMGWSLERRPGGEQGNWLDSNDNLADAWLNNQPAPQGLSAPAVPATPVLSPAHSPSAEPAPTPSESIDPDDPEATIDPDDPEPTIDLDDPEPTLEPEPSMVPAPTAAPITASPVPSPAPTPVTSASPPPSTTPVATPVSPPPAASNSPAPSATPATPIAGLRGLPLGTAVTVRGVLTTPIGLTESGKGAFIQDDTAGVALYLASADWPAQPAGTQVVVQGVLETRFSLLTVRLASAAGLAVEGSAALPDPVSTATGAVGEALEGRLVRVQGDVSDGVSNLTDGFSTAIDDGSGALRVIVAQASGISREEFPRGRGLTLTGVVGQRDSSGTGTAGYRLHLRSVEDVVELPPTITPTPSPAESAGPSHSPTASPGATPSLSASPSSSTSTVMAISAARQLAPGQRTTVRGVVTAPPGRILDELMIVVQDTSGGICVKLTAPVHPDIVPGRLLEIEGVLAAPYGNLELRALADGVLVLGMAGQPAPRDLTVAQLNEQHEGLLARLKVTVRRIEASSSGSVTLTVEDDSGQGRIFFFGALGVAKQQFSGGDEIVATGIVGDRLGLYRLWPRSESDIQFVPGNPPEPDPGNTASPSPSGPGGGNGSNGANGNNPAPISIAQALARQGQTVTIEGVVTAPNGLLDADPRRVTVQDASAAILFRLPVDAANTSVGQRLRLVGQVGTYYGAPQLTVAAPPVKLEGGTPSVMSISAAPLPQSSEWRLVKVTGRVETVRRNGESWRAELVLAGGGLPIIGLARSGIASTALTVGREATITGIVRRAYPTATDQRLGIVPRGAADISLGGNGSVGEGPAGDPSSGQAAGPDGQAGPGYDPANPAGQPAVAPRPAVPAVKLADLAAHQGEEVHVGGFVEDRQGMRLLVNDGTATATFRLSGHAEKMLPLLAPGLVVDVRGVVERTAAGSLEVHVADAAAIAYSPRNTASRSPGAGPPEGAPASPAISASDSDATLADEPAGARLLFLLGLLGMTFASVGVVLQRRPEWLRPAHEALAALRRRLSGA